MAQTSTFSATPTTLPALGWWWLRFPAGALRIGPHGDLWIARALWILALPAQYYVLQHYLDYDLGPAKIQDVIVFSLISFLIIAMLGTVFQVVFSRDSGVSRRQINFRQSIMLCWILSTVLYGIVLQFPGLAEKVSFYLPLIHSKIGPQSDLVRLIGCIILEYMSKLGLNTRLECTDVANLPLYVAIHLTCALFACLLTILAVAIARRFRFLNDASIASDANPPLVLVWLVTGVALALVYYISMSNWMWSQPRG